MHVMLLSTLQGVMRNVQDVLHLATYVSVGVSAGDGAAHTTHPPTTLSLLKYRRQLRHVQIMSKRMCCTCYHTIMISRNCVEVCKWMCHACRHKPKDIHTSTCTAPSAQLHLHSPPPVQLRMGSQQGKSEPDPHIDLSLLGHKNLKITALKCSKNVQAYLTPLLYESYGSVDIH